MKTSSARPPAGIPSLSVPLTEAKNQLSPLIARVEQGEEICITRRSMPVARLVPDPPRQAARQHHAQMVTDAPTMVDQQALLPIRIDGTPAAAATLLSLALRYDPSCDDAAYRQLPTARRDGALAAAVWDAGVGVLEAA